MGKVRHLKYFKKVDVCVVKRLEVNDGAGIRMSKNFKSLVVEVREYENMPFEEKECQNYIDKPQ